jgi:putative two-component system response regulator
VLAQIVGICDVYDALTSDRPYRPALSDAEAVEWLLKDMRAGKFSPRFVEAFLDVTAARRGTIAQPALN